VTFPLRPEHDPLALLVDGLAPVPPSAEARARLSAELHGPLRFSAHAPRVAALFRIPEADARAALRAAAAGQGFRPELWPGAEVLRHPALSPAGAVIARIPPGLALAEHVHGLRELTFVLDGELSETAGGATVQHGSGSVLDWPAGSRHALQVGQAAHCLVVFGLCAR
jgi:anti-sigma factor ChrR (cupin superfamily)